MAEFLANESGTDLVTQFQSSIRAGTRRTDTGVTHAAIDIRGFHFTIDLRPETSYT